MCSAVPGQSWSSIKVLKFPRKTWPSQSQPGEVLFTSFQLSGELGWCSACTHYSEHDKCIIFCLIMFNTTAAASLWNLSTSLFLVKSLNTVDFQPSRFSFSNTMLILHNTCSQQTRVSWLQHKHAAIYCAGGSSGLYTPFVPIIFFCLWRTDNIMLEMAMTVSGPFPSLLSNMGEQRAPAARQHFSKTEHA